MNRGVPFVRAFALAAAAVLLLLPVGCAEEPLPTPQGAKAAVTDDGAVSLLWQPTAGAAGYRIFKSQDTPYSYKFKDECTAPPFTDTAVEPGRTYYYQVQAINEKTTSERGTAAAVAVPASAESDCHSLTPETRPRIEAAVRLDRFTAIIQAAEQPAGTAMLVFRSEKADGDYAPVGESDSAVFYDGSAPAGRPYFYKIRFAESDGSVISAFSAPVAASDTAAVVGIPVVSYHEVLTPEDVAKGATLDEFSVYARELEQDLLWLRKAGYHPVTAAQILRFLDGKASLPSKPILLIVDDGKIGIYRHAFPIMKKHRVPMTLSAIGRQIDFAPENPGENALADETFCTWAQVKDMADSGLVEVVSNTYGLHTYSKNGRRGAATSAGESAGEYFPVAQKDYIIFQGVLQERLGFTTAVMCYPYSDRNPESDKAWFKCGYQLLIGGEKEMARTTRINYFWQPAGRNPWSGVLRVLSRKHGEPVEQLLRQAEKHDRG